MTRTIPILTYHSVAENPADWIAPFTVSPRLFEDHLEAIAAAGATTLTVSSLVKALGGGPDQLPERPVLLTFDDGFADFRHVALPALSARGMSCTLYVATGYLERRSGPAGERMLGFEDLGELDEAGVEIGAHSHSHPQLDVLPLPRARHEVEHCKALLEQALGWPVRSFAYPHGYSSPAVRRLVRGAGYRSACAVGNALSHPADDPFRLARLLVGSTTGPADLARWLAGQGAPRAPRRERARTRAWRAYRRVGVRAGLRAESELPAGADGSPRGPRPELPPLPSSPSLGVVICAYSPQRWDALRAAVASVAAQSPAPREIVVVIDHNDELLSQAREGLHPTRVLASDHRPGLSGARNAGLHALEADVAVFLDDDACPEPDWLASIAAAFADPAVIGVGGWVEPRWEARRSWLAAELHWVVGCSYRGLPDGVAVIRNPIGANMAFRRDVLTAVGGFSEQVGRVLERPLGDEETDVAIRAQARWPEAHILHVPQAVVGHAVPARRASWSYLVSRCWSEGRSKARLASTVGASPALASERDYVTRVLPKGVARGLLDGLRGDAAGPARAASILLALTVTVAGYLLERVWLTTSARAPSRPSW